MPVQVAIKYMVLTYSYCILLSSSPQQPGLYSRYHQNIKPEVLDLPNGKTLRLRQLSEFGQGE
jgi:hypothetical protein